MWTHIDRRFFLGLTVSLAGAAIAGSALADKDNPGSMATTDLEARAEAQLRSFLTRIIGQPENDRIRAAQNVIKEIDAMDASSLLLEGVAYGVLVRGAKLVTDILRSGYHKQSKQGLDYALQQMPNSAWTHTLNGAWHFEALRRSTLGSFALGASKKKGDDFFDKATSLAGKDPGIHLALALSYLSDNPKQNAEIAALRLQAALDMIVAHSGQLEGDAAYTDVVAQYAGLTLEKLNSEGPAKTQDYVLSIF
jgi:hypothetical protein